MFTKLGLLVNKLKAEALEDGENLDDAAINERKRESLEKLCFAPVRNAVGGGNVSHVAVSSTRKRYSFRLLIRLWLQV